MATIDLDGRKQINNLVDLNGLKLFYDTYVKEDVKTLMSEIDILRNEIKTLRNIISQITTTYNAD